MKKVLVASAALMLAGGIVAPAFAADATPGIVITGDARARYYYKSEDYFNAFGNINTPGVNSQLNLDSRVRFDLTGTSAGGAYIKGRIRMMENLMGDMDTDINQINQLNQNNIWADKAYFGVPFTKDITLEVGKYRSTYGPLPLTYNFFYDDVNLTGARGIVKIGSNVEINPFFEYMKEAQNVNTTGSSTLNPPPNTPDQLRDHDEVRYGVHAKGKINQDWTVGGMLGYQQDQRNEAPPSLANPTGITQNSGGFGSIYTNGKVGKFALVGEVGVTAADINGFNAWREDSNTIVNDAIGSNDTGFGGWIFPNYTIDKLNLGLNAGFTSSGFLPDRAFGFVMLGSTDNSVITAQQIGTDGDWMWVGFVPTYTFNESLKLWGNLVYANVSNNWKDTGDGPGFVKGTNQRSLDSAWELSAVLQYTIVKGADVFFAVGYLDPSLEYVNKTATAAPLKDDSVLGAYTRFELKF